MNYLDIINELVADKFNPNEEDYLHMYKKSLEMLNKIKLSRFKAMFFGSMQIGNPDMFVWKNIKEFTKNYQVACIYVMSTLRDNTSDRRLLIETTLSMLHSMLAKYFDDKDLDKETIDLINKNDKFCKGDELENVING